ncbi:hypothetical protein [Priestia aryabhattai]|uniref:hypothetical protein n=1 Tax=Priestia aryabhattai TaxID=412384 RepID=UPI001CFE137C|nr:hypothetical protein [Priestia aryabhattai]
MNKQEKDKVRVAHTKKQIKLNIKALIAVMSVLFCQLSTPPTQQISEYTFFKVFNILGIIMKKQ